MKAASTALQALLASRQFYACCLYTLNLRDGTVLRYSDGDCNITANGNLYSCGGFSGPYFGRDQSAGQFHTKLGTDVDQQVIEVMIGSATIKGMPFMHAIEWGWLDGAWLEIDDAYLPSVMDATHWPLSATGTLYCFSGDVAEIDGGDGVIAITVNSPLAALQAQQNQLPRGLWQPGCANVLGDADCGVTVTTVAGTVAAGGNAGLIMAALPQANDWFDLGILTFTSGALASLAQSIATWSAGSPGSFDLMTPFPQAPAVGDSFTVSRGCDGSLGPMGCPKFGGNFRGTPFVPPPTAAN